MMGVTKKEYDPFAILKRRASFRASFKLLLTPPARLVSCKCDVLIIDTHAIEARSDYREIIKNVFSAIKDITSTNITDNGANGWFLRFGLRFKFFLKILFLVFWRSISCFKLKYFSELNSFYRDYYRNLISCCEPKIVITFCDAHPQDYIISSVAKDLGVLTITLQHGLYRFEQNGFNVNNLLIENSISDYICVWGRHTAQLFLSNNTNGVKPVVVGSPRSDYGFDFSHTAHTFCSVSAVNAQLVVYLDSDDNFTTNCLILDFVHEILGEYHYPVHVKFHPKSKKWRYKRFRQMCGPKLSDRFDITIGFSSAVLLGPLLKGDPVLILRGSDPNAPYSSYPYTFYDVASLRSLINEVSEGDFCSKQVLNFMSEILVNSDVSLNYSSLIRNLIEDTQ